MVVKAAVSPATTDDGADLPRRRSGWRFVPIVVVVLGLTAGYALGWQRYLTLAYLESSQQTLRGMVAAHPLAAPMGFVLCYAVAIAFSFPAASVLTIAGGFLFGWALGGGLSIIAATAGATALFLSARSALGDSLRHRLSGFSARLADGFERDAFTFLLVLRLAPFMPFVIVNIASALFKVRLRTFVAATALGIIPAAFAYAWLGEGVGSVLEAAAAAGRHAKVTDLVTPEITIAFAALALVALAAAVVKRRWKGSAEGAGR